MSDGIYFQFRLAMAAGGGARVRRQAKTIDDGAKRDHCHNQESEMEVA